VHNGYLVQHFNPDLQLPDIGSWEEMEEREVNRIRRALSVSILAGTIPNRSTEPADDKRKARRVSHALRNSLKGWTKISNQLPLDDSVRREAVSLQWDKWVTRHVTIVESEIVLVATWAIKLNFERWGRSAVVNLTNERQWVTYAVRA
jgi:hypothetical protein